MLSRQVGATSSHGKVDAGRLAPLCSQSPTRDYSKCLDDEERLHRGRERCADQWTHDW